MKIAFSARGLSIPSGGVHRFIKSLIPALAKQIDDDELFVFYNDKKFLGLASDCSEIVIKGSNRICWDFVLLPKMLRKLKIDAAIFPKNVVPFFAGCRCYAVIHDLAYFDRRLNAYPFLDAVYMRTLIPQSVRRAAGVFAVSENTKKDIIRYTGCDPQKITVTYLAADKIYRPVNNSEQLQNVKQKYAIPQKFIMYVGSLSPRKNINRLLEAFSIIRDRIPHHLVLTGSKSWKDSSVYRTMRRLNLSDRIKKLGYVENEDMPVLYNLADAYVYPSLYEGFGLPILEAMQCGCPVVASNATSIPEVAGDAAIFVNPLDIDALADAIYNVLTDDQLRRKLISSGFRQAEKFSWDSTANIMLETIRQTFMKDSPAFFRRR
ncbi:MAG: glycosyltransferase family 1 protein [Planctomycetota bacterium]|nr:MAG: glycosyltransferase family 1 protein [Planctomycetota bacterium]